MKKLFTVLFLVLVSFSSYGEMVVYTIDSNKTIYVDPKTIRRDGNFVEFWMIHSYNSPMNFEGNTLYYSTKGRSRYDCKNELQRTLFFTVYDGKDGTGNVLGVQNYVNEKPNWVPVIPDTPNMVVFKKVCSK